MTVEDQLIRLAEAKTDSGPTDLMQLCLFDWAVCALAGQAEPAGALLAMACDTEGECSVIGGGQTSAAEAALINGTMGHALDYDDTHFGHIGHTSAVVMPALIALGEDIGADLHDILSAALIGSEAALRTGLWLGRAHYQIGFHQTATAGAIGATLGAARLLDLTAAEMRHALGLAATAASGLKGQFGTMGKPLNAGLAARTAVESVLWAQMGLTSDPAGLSGPQGFGATHHGAGDATAFDGPDWQITDISHKFHACCHGLHAMLEALRDAPDDVAGLTIITHPRWMSVCNQAAPDTGLGVKFSYRHTAAMALAGIDTGDIAQFSDRIAQDPALCARRETVKVIADEDLGEMQARVICRSGDGTETTLFHDLGAPLGMAARRLRLRTKAATVLGLDPADDLWKTVEGGDLAALTTLLRG